MFDSMSFEFDRRVNEVEYYFFCLEKMYQFNDQKQSEPLKKKMNTDEYEFQDFLIILKANSFVVLYNLIEASIKKFIISIYDIINMEELNYNDVCNELKKIWINIYYDDLSHTTTNYSQHKEKAKDMIDFIIDQQVINFKDDVKLSGNADLQQIKKVFKNHGLIILPSVYREVGGGLREVKNKRNNIAHGNISFIEAGRDSTLSDLFRYKKEIVLFLKELDEFVSLYISNEEYLSH